MQNKIELYGFFRSRSNRAHWALEEIGCPYDFYQLDFAKGENRSEFYLAINPAGKVPALRDGDLVITESAAICNYLGTKFPDNDLTPKGGSPDRVRYDQWMYFVLSELEQPLWTNGKHTFALPEAVRVPAVLETANWEFEKAVSLMSKGLGDREFMLDSHFTMVDIMVAQTLRWAVNFKFDVPHDNLMSYLTRMEERPAYARIAEKEQLRIPQR